MSDRKTATVFAILVTLGIAVNLFGALTFGRAMKYYRTGGDAYGTIVRH